MGDRLMQYKDFEFPLDWLLDDESVRSAGDKYGTAVVEWPGGRLFIHPRQYVTRGPSGRLEIVTGEILP